LRTEALYTEENLGRMKENGTRRISRVPGTIREAEKAVESAEISAMHQFDKHYHYQSVKSEYGGVVQRWLVVHSEYDRAIRAVNKMFLKQSEAEVRDFEKLCRKEFACLPDARNAPEEFGKELKFTQSEEFGIVKTFRYEGRGRPGKGSKPEKIVFQIRGALSVSLEKRQDMLWQKSCFIIATDETDEEKLSDIDLFEGYKGQSRVEKGFRFLKDPMFLSSSLYLKNPKRIMALMMVMTLCLLVYASPEYKIRKELKERNRTFPDQKGKPINNPTAKWIFQCFEGIHILILRGKKEIILNLNDRHRSVLNLSGIRYEAFYS